MRIYYSVKQKHKSCKNQNTTFQPAMPENLPYFISHKKCHILCPKHNENVGLCLFKCNFLLELQKQANFSSHLLEEGKYYIRCRFKKKKNPYIIVILFLFILPLILELITVLTEILPSWVLKQLNITVLTSSVKY